MALVLGLQLAINRAKRIRHGSPTVVPKYYFSSTGDDANDGLSESLPKQSISELNSLVLEAGDIVGLKCGDSFNGQITIGQSGTSGNPITITSYGEGEKPKIYGSEVITGWTLHSGNIWKATFATDITQLFVDGEKMKLARLTNSGYNLVTGVTSRSVVTVNAASQASNYYSGCSVLTRTENWYSEMRTVSSSSGNTLTLNSNVSSDFNIGEGVILMNKLEFLDSPGEWYYDSAADLVYVWMPNSDSPDGYELRGSTISNGIDVNTKSYITIQNIEILHQKNNGISATGTGSSTGNIFTNNTISGQEQAAIYGHTTDAQNITVSNNIISNCNEAGVYFRNIGNSTIQDNTISNIGLINEIGNLGTGVQGNGSGIACVVGDASGKNYVKYNDIQNVNYNGIRFTGLSDIQYNYIKNCLLHKADGAGIYTETAAGSVISYNIIDNSVGSVEGRPSGALTFGNGIYTDEVASDITVSNNSIMNISHSAIYTNRVDNCTYTYNKTLNARYGINKVNYSGTTPSTINYNTFITGSATDEYEPRQLVARYGDGNATFDNNTYINGFASDLVFRGTDDNYKNFADWKTNISGDAASSYLGNDLTENENQRLVYNNSKTEKTFYLNVATTVKDENGTSVTDSFVLQPYTSKYVRGFNLDCILDYEDSTAPTITAFTIPASSESLVVEITTFTGSEGTTGYLITESATAPTLLTAGWSETAPATFTASGGSSVTLYAWVRDAAGNISASASDATTLPDLTANLLANYYFTETSGTVSEDLIGTADGTINGSPTMDGTKFTLDGTDDYISFPLPTVLNSNQYNSDFSINIKFTIFATPDAAKRLFTQSSSFTRGVQIVLNTNREIYGIITENDGPVTSGRIKTGALDINTVHNVTVTWDAANNTLKMYLNGNEVTTTYASNGLNGNTSGIRLGSNLNAAYINADVYELSIFDKQLSGSEVTQWINR